MTATRVVTYCARPGCGALETMHEIRANGTRGRRYATGAEILDDRAQPWIACTGYEPGRVEERVPEEEQRRRLDAISTLKVQDPTPSFSGHPDAHAAWLAGYATALSLAKRAARGEA